MLLLLTGLEGLELEHVFTHSLAWFSVDNSGTSPLENWRPTGISYPPCHSQDPFKRIAGDCTLQNNKKEFRKSETLEKQSGAKEKITVKVSC